MKINLPVLLISITIAAVFVIGVPFVLTKVLTRNNASTPRATTDTTTIKKPASYANINATELKSYLDNEKDIYLLDVHIPEQTHIEGTDNFIPFNEIEKSVSELPEDRNTEIIVYCRSGNMSEAASQKLVDLGYKNVKNLKGGINAWKARGYE